jgi:inner membrane protein
VNPVEHFLIGWTVAASAPIERRDRAIVVIAGVIPDIDGLGMLAEIPTRGTRYELLWWTDYHHVLTHNIGFAVLCTVAAFALARSRWLTALLAFITFHLHLLGDVVGARGPDGYDWPIPYLLPFSHRWEWSWSGQWALNAWPNFVITGLALAYTFWMAWRKGFSPVEMISKRADAAFVTALQQRFGMPATRSPVRSVSE